MGKITDNDMKAKPSAKGKWISESVIWGHGSLAGRVTPTGERLFYFRYLNSSGERITLPIATYDRNAHPIDLKTPLLERIGKSMSLADARDLARTLADIHKGTHANVAEHLDMLRAESQASSEAEIARLAQEKADAEQVTAALAARMTITDLFEHWIRIEVSQRKNGAAEMRRSFSKDVLPVIGHLFVEDVKKAHIMQVVDPILARGTNRMAKVTFSSLRQMFRFAVDRDFIESDPTASIRKAKIGGKENERDRVLTEEEIRDLYKMAPNAALLPTTEAAIWIALSTCCRIGELLAANWSDIDFDRQEWTIPSENSKNGRPHVIFLSQFAVDQFRQLHTYSGYTPWVYPNTKDTGPICSKTITKQLTDRQRSPEAGPMSNRSSNTTALLLPGGKWTAHDLRRTGATLMTVLGVIPEVAERCLNHTEDNKMKRIYQRHNYAGEMREAWLKLGQRLEILTKTSTSNVVVFRGR